VYSGLRRDAADHERGAGEVQQGLHHLADREPGGHAGEGPAGGQAEHQHAVQDRLHLLHRPAVQPAQRGVLVIAFIHLSNHSGEGDFGVGGL
jgi:hypothetical protein